VGPGVWGGPDNPELRRTVDVFPIGGATRLYDSMLRAYRVLEYRALSLSNDPLFRAEDELDPWPVVGPCSRRSAERAGERRRAIVLLTDGGDLGSNSRYADILQTSWHAEVPVFPVAVGMAGVSAARWRTERASRGRRTTIEAARYAEAIDEVRSQLTEMARVTGGHMVSQRDIRRGYDDVLGLLRGYYVIGYRGEQAKEGWSEVEVEVNEDDLDVIVQPGVYRFSQSVRPALDALRRGRALFARGDYEEALAEFDIAVALDREVGAPYYGRGLVLEALERWEEARDSYLSALQWDPGSPAATGRLADVSLHLGDHAASWEYAIRARLSGVDVRGVVAMLNERADAPEDLDERLARPVITVLSPQVPSLTALLDTRDLMRQIITRIDDSPEFGYATRERFGDVVMNTRVVRHELRDGGAVRAEVVFELYQAERGKVREEKLTIDNLDDGDAAAAALADKLDRLLRWVAEHVEPRERASDPDGAAQ
jgi:tetratricopeptide (TPR) repeat protein